MGQYMIEIAHHTMTFQHMTQTVGVNVTGLIQESSLGIMINDCISTICKPLLQNVMMYQCNKKCMIHLIMTETLGNTQKF